MLEISQIVFMKRYKLLRAAMVGQTDDETCDVGCKHFCFPPRFWRVESFVGETNINRLLPRVRHGFTSPVDHVFKGEPALGGRKLNGFQEFFFFWKYLRDIFYILRIFYQYSELHLVNFSSHLNNNS